MVKGKARTLIYKKDKVLSYFESKVIPSFKQHATVWILRAASLRNPSKGITNNPSESFNAVLHRLQKWKHIPIDAITVSLYYLSSYFRREITKSLHQCGRWDEFDFLKMQPAMMPHLAPTWDPNDIVDKVSTFNCVTQLSHTTSNSSDTGQPPLKSTTHIGLTDDA